MTPNVLISGEMKLCNSSAAVGSVQMDTMHNGNLGCHESTYLILKIELWQTEVFWEFS